MMLEMKGPSVRVEQVGAGSNEGRRVVANRQILAGECVAKEESTLMYPSPSRRHEVCYRCLSRADVTLCETCGMSASCSKRCADEHTEGECSALACLAQVGPDGPTEAEMEDAWIVCKASKLSEEEWEQVMGLCTSPGGASAHEGKLERLGPVLERLGMEKRACSLLLSKEAANGIALTGSAEEEPIGSALMARIVSKFNHSCLPNCERIDWVGANASDEKGSVSVEMRAVDNLDEGQELTISYFPINSPLDERRKKLANEYGFHCSCKRCEVEERARDSGLSEEGDREWKELEVWLLARLCDGASCRGMLYPIEVGYPLARVRCSLCGKERTYDELVAILSGSHTPSDSHNDESDSQYSSSSDAL